MRTHPRLTSDASLADFVVDVANVVRERTLGGDRGADLGRFLALLDGLVAFTGDATTQVYAVCDRSLLSDGRLTREERQTLAEWHRAGLLSVWEVADHRIIEAAEATRAQVVTYDGFVDFHRRHPWLYGNRDRFVEPYPGPGGAVSVRRRIMPEPDDWQMSRKEEESALLAAGMYDRRDGTGPRTALLLRRWRCPEPDCAAFGPAAHGALPRRQGRTGRVVCPEHLRELTDLGPRPRQMQLKVRVDGTVRHRFLLTEGQDLVVGRHPRAEPGERLAAWLPERSPSLEWISRDHVLLRISGGNLLVSDVSSNGTWLRLPDGQTHRVPRGAFRSVGRRHVVLLHDTVQLEVSGKSFLYEERAEGEPPPRPRPETEGESQQPTMLAPSGPRPAGSRGKRPGRGGRRRR
ncbi:hypothetical protein [Streptomyces griseochromogenes]|uniref:hypothetical protein n=1 Tax=Streptomyces griseochromogenes TaxID=68214 RepID=UPI00379E2158